MEDKVADAAIQLLYREAAFLDQKRWAEWLELYTEDAEFWIPAWDSEHDLTNDPRGEMSLMYYDSRAGLEDRAFRIQTEDSGASTPLPRTCHLITNVRIEDVGDGRIRLFSNWVTQVFSNRKRTTHSFSGFYEHVLRREGDRLRIEKKKITVINDVIPSVLDIYSV